MPRTLPFRLTAGLLALLTCLSTPLLASAHSRAHARLALAHHAAHPAAQPGEVDAHALESDLAEGTGASAGGGAHGQGEVEVPEHDHAHGHPALDIARAERDGAGLGGAVLAPRTAPVADGTSLPVDRADRAAPRNRALLARPGPDTGPRPSPRAPPLR